MIRPAKRTVLLLTADLGAALLPAVVDARLFPVWCAATGVVLFAAGLDVLLAPGRRDLELTVDAPETLYMADGDPLKVRMSFRGRIPVTTVELLPEFDEHLPPGAIVSGTVRSGRTTEYTCLLRPRRRGTARVERLWLAWTGPLGLMRRTLRREVAAEIPVLPNVRAVRTAAIRRFRDRHAFAGLKTERYLGDGTEFDSLREYRPGHDHRAIDWKASARHVRLIAREYRAERNHQIVIAIDAGHLMREPIEDVPRLDHAINAGLLLSYACLKTGDRVGLFTFDEKVRDYTEPRGGVATFSSLKARTSSIEYSTGETNFTLALMSLLGKLRRRTLVVLFTEFVDTVTVELLVENVARLTKRHLVLCITFRDPRLIELAEATPRSLEDLNRAVAAADLLREREVVLRRLARLGVHSIDAPVAAVSTRLIDRYLEIKRREQL